MTQAWKPAGLRRTWPWLVDGAMDGLLIAFAGWTLFYQVGLAAQRSVRWAAWPWLVVAAALMVVCAAAESRRWSERRVEPEPTGEPADEGSVGASSADAEPVRRRGACAVALLLGGAALVIAVLVRSSIGVTPVALIGVVVLLVQLVPWWSYSRAARSHTADIASTESVEPAGWEHAVAAATSLGLGVLGSFLLVPNADDVFYVNRATWIANHGVPPINDTVFSADKLPPVSDGGIQTPSVEALQGSLAHAFHAQAAGVAYLAFVPVLSALVGWALWRLVRAWAPRRHALVLLVAVLFILVSGQGIVGNYSIGRIWQGKVAACAVLLPLVWTYFTKVVQERRSTLMLFVAGIVFVGLTTTSALLSPLIFAAALVAALVLRSKPLAWAAGAFVAAPLVNGLVQKFGPTPVGSTSSVASPASEVFTLAFGASTALAVVGVLGVALGPTVMRSRASVIAMCAALTTLGALVPGVLQVADMVTGAGPVIWRLAITAPIAVLVGLLASLPLVPIPTSSGLGPRLTAAVPGLVVLVLVCWFLASATWLWEAKVGGSLTSSPTWKVDQSALSDLRAVQRLDVPPGRWLLPPAEMQIMAISTVGPFAVVPRSFYLTNLATSEDDRSRRSTLLRLSAGNAPAPHKVTSALRHLDVSLACVPSASSAARERLATAVGDQRLRPVGKMRCWIRPPTH